MNIQNIKQIGLWRWSMLVYSGLLLTLIGCTPTSNVQPNTEDTTQPSLTASLAAPGQLESFSAQGENNTDTFIWERPIDSLNDLANIANLELTLRGIDEESGIKSFQVESEVRASCAPSPGTVNEVFVSIFPQGNTFVSQQNFTIAADASGNLPDRTTTDMLELHISEIFTQCIDPVIETFFKLDITVTNGADIATLLTLFVEIPDELDL